MLAADAAGTAVTRQPPNMLREPTPRVHSLIASHRWCLDDHWLMAISAVSRSVTQIDPTRNPFFERGNLEPAMATHRAVDIPSIIPRITMRRHL